MFGHLISSWFWAFTGARNEGGAAYGLQSGVGGSLPDLTLLLGVAVWYLRNTCHDSWKCFRWGKYEAAGGMFRLCRHHHPDLDGRRPHRELIARMHGEHKQTGGSGT